MTSHEMTESWPVATPGTLLFTNVKKNVLECLVMLEPISFEDRRATVVTEHSAVAYVTAEYLFFIDVRWDP